jgi:hypothetical protein
MGAERKNPTIADLASQTRQRWLDPNVEETIHSTQTRPRSTWWFSRAVWLGFPIGFRLVSVLTVEWLSEALSWWARAAAAQGFPLLDSHRIDRRRCPESAIQAAASRAYSSTHASYIESHTFLYCTMFMLFNMQAVLFRWRSYRHNCHSDMFKFNSSCAQQARHDMIRLLRVFTRLLWTSSMFHG